MAHDTPEQVKHQASFVSTRECLLWHIISCSSLSTRLRLKWLPLNTAVSFASAGKTLGWCRRKLDRTISIKIWMYNYLPPHSVSVPMFGGCSSASQKTALISLSHQMGVKISVFHIFMYKINKHFVCALPKRGEGYVINLGCFLKLNCLCGFLFLKIPWFIHKSYYEMSCVKKFSDYFHIVTKWIAIEHCVVETISPLGSLWLHYRRGQFYISQPISTQLYQYNDNAEIFLEIL